MSITNAITRKGAFMHTRKAVTPPPPPGQLTVVLKRGDKVIKTQPLPDFGETKIVTHGARVTFVEASTKEKVE